MKRQRTLFDLASNRIKRESDAAEQSDKPILQILCPVCELDLSALTIFSRNTHVNKCIDPNFINEIPSNIPADTSVVVKHESETIITDVKIETDIVLSPKKKQKTTKKQTSKPKRIPKPKRPIPDIKILNFNPIDTGDNKIDADTANKNIIAVDAFCYEADPKISIYLLTHFHSDHYGGMTKSWDRGSLIVCTDITSRLMNLKFKYPFEKMLVLSYNQTMKIPNTDITITCLDANHCPGAGIFILECNGLRYLHCGDFRCDQEMIDLLNAKFPTGFDKCYIDNTYLNEKYTFPKQQDVVDETSDWIKQKCSTFKSTQYRVIDFFSRNSKDFKMEELLIVIGTYSIGKERLAIGIANALGSKIYCTKEKYEILQQYQWEELDTLITKEDPCRCQIHLMPMMKTKKDHMIKYLNSYDKSFKSVLVVIPTGWTETYTSDRSQSLSVRYDKSFDRCAVGNPVHKIHVPYSEHSSFDELSNFFNCIKAKEWLHTVGMSGR